MSDMDPKVKTCLGQIAYFTYLYQNLVVVRHRLIWLCCMC